MNSDSWQGNFVFSHRVFCQQKDYNLLGFFHVLVVLHQDIYGSTWDVVFVFSRFMP
jgi:hypothetical protein